MENLDNFDSQERISLLISYMPRYSHLMNNGFYLKHILHYVSISYDIYSLKLIYIMLVYIAMHS